MDRGCGDRDQGTLAWKVYPTEIPEEQLVIGKSGTVEIERNNCRQRHWFAQFKRKSIVLLHRINIAKQGDIPFLRSAPLS
ncbi:MAG: hypothetical protein LBN96_02320 [Desulfovibrio sp.]|nr:hypothetical protein [Desulfovibrio sp.]